MQAGARPERMQFGDRRPFRWTFAAAAVALVALGLYGVEFDLGLLVGERARGNAARFFEGCWPPRTDGPFVGPLFGLALDTVCVAALATAVAVLLGVPLGILGCRAATLGSLFVTGDIESSWLHRGLYLAARAVGAVFRSVPELVWAMLFVRVFGLGPSPAILAIGVAYGGMLGKVYSEQLEAVDPRPVTALESVGAGRAAAFAWGILPQAFGPMASYTAYRFECAVRASALMGLVGAGGLGQRIQFSQLDNEYAEIATEVAILMAVVVAVEWISDEIKRRIA